MDNFVILTDSCCDLPAALAAEWKVEAIPLALTIAGKTYRNFLDEREISYHDFYQFLREQQSILTTAPNIDDFISYMKPHLEKGEDILYLGFSSALSASYNVGTVAAKELSEQYPQRKIMTVDSLSASLGQGLLVSLMVAEQQKGHSIEEVAAFAEKMKYHICHWFMVEDLNHLKRGGRIPATTAMVGTILNIKPILHFDNEGKMISMENGHGRNKSIKRLAEIVLAKANNLSEQTVYISHVDCFADAERLEQLLKELGVKKTMIHPVGPVIGAHTGPGTMAVFFIGDQR
ncbi:MAG: DegV family protein [Negativicutes bacterium]|nr:DegV family protein [Negativicutes bacterium]